MKSFIIALIVLITVTCTQQQRPYKVYFDDVKTFCNLDFCSTNSTFADLSIAIDVEITKTQKDALAKGKLVTNVNQNIITLFDQTSSYCTLDESMKKVPLLNGIMSDVSKKLTLPWKCPLEAGKYTMRDFVFDPNVLPTFLPDTVFKFEFTILTNPEVGNPEPAFTFVLDGRIKN